MGVRERHRSTPGKFIRSYAFSRQPIEASPHDQAPFPRLPLYGGRHFPRNKQAKQFFIESLEIIYLRKKGLFSIIS